VRLLQLHSYPYKEVLYLDIKRFLQLPISLEWLPPRNKKRKEHHLPSLLGFGSALLKDVLAGKRTLPDIVIAGGMARSGTTFIEAVLNAHPQVICLQEFMPLKTSLLADLLHFIAQSTDGERQLWSDESGCHWRGYEEAEDHLRMFSLLIACLATTTRADVLRDKKINAIRTLYCKTPNAEFHLQRLQEALPAIPLKYVHCIRAPLDCLRSNWEMPWVHANDSQAWVNDFATTLGASADAVRSLQTTDIPVFILNSSRIWNAQTRKEEAERFFEFLGVEWSDNAFRKASEIVDPWPAARRRTPATEISESDEQAFANHPELQRWLATFENHLH
jgi:hypothetical protein